MFEDLNRRKEMRPKVAKIVKILKSKKVIEDPDESLFFVLSKPKLGILPKFLTNFNISFDRALRF